MQSVTHTVGVIGAGWVTRARHIPALRRSRRCRVVGVIDHHLDRARDLAGRFKIPQVSEGLKAPWLDEADAVTIGVSPLSHFEVARSMLERGKHVLLEKPMCLSVAEGEALARSARQKHLTLAIVHNFQFARSVLRARALLASGRWGRVVGLHGFQLSNEKRRLPTWYDQL